MNKYDRVQVSRKKAEEKAKKYLKEDQGRRDATLNRIIELARKEISQ